jgi:predicted metal-dependent enzyme (double-stranded beta helix superfamily)
MHLASESQENFRLSLSQKIKAGNQIPVVQTLVEADNKLIITGQGTIAITIEPKPFSISVRNSLDTNSSGYDLVVTESCATFYRYEQGEKKILCPSKQINIDLSKECQYWFSLDRMNSRLRYGIGEQRVKTIVMEHTLDCHNPWIDDIKYISFHLENCQDPVIEVYRDPVVIEPPLLVVSSNELTMDMAAKYEAIVVENLSIECQKLYANIVGDLFQLNTPDFPNFSDAIAKSIQDPQGWCYQELKKKESEFGKPDPLATYLRITLGINQGESPGIPYVMEIWPNGHYSPIHNHAGANAIIKVLHGDIKVNLFDMLSVSHTKPFKEVTISKGDITWIVPKLNQTHQLHNQSEQEPCITIQCYLYNIDDNSHYEYFDYIDNQPGQECIKQFLPNSDMDFLEFKQQMKKEWDPVPVFLYKAENPSRYYYTTNPLDSPGQEWTKVGIAFNAFQANTAEAVPTYKFSAPSPQRYDFRTNAVPSPGWTNESQTAFYVLMNKTTNSTPVYQYHQIIGNGFWNLFYSLDPNDPSVKDWINDGIIFHVFGG